MKTIALLAFENCQILDVCGPLQVFASANGLLERPGYRIGICAERPGEVHTNSGLRLVADWPLAQLPEVDTFLVAGGSGIFQAVEDPGLIARVQALSGQCRRLGSICSGSFLLARAGLLQHRRAVTHWRYCRRLQQEYPEIRVDADALYTRDGNVYTSAGITAGIDLALSLLAEDHGQPLAGAVARELVMFMHRPGGQSQFSLPLRAGQTDNPASAALRRVLDHIHRQPDGRLDLDTLAEIAGLSARHLSRLFRQQVGQTAADYVECFRLSLACEQLEHGNSQLQQVAKACGFGSADHLRRAMKRQQGISPNDYRQRFTAHGVSHER